MNNRAYSFLKIKAVDEDQRIITGIATTPTPDRMNDIVEPAGAEFLLPIPLLWQHDHTQPIGQVTSAKVTEEGIEVTARIAQVSSPSGLSARLEEAWQSIKAGLVRGLSIGFRAKEYSYLDDTDGIRFSRWEWYELSAVTIPANAQANIQTFKTIDSKLRTATGQLKQPSVVRLDPSPAGASAHQKTLSSKPKEGRKMNIQEQIKQFQDTRKLKAERMKEIMEGACGEGATLDAAQTEEYDTLEDEVKHIDKHIDRLKGLEKINIETAKPITATPTDEQAKSLGQKTQVKPVFSVKTNNGGIALAQVVKFLGRAQGNRLGALELAKQATDIDHRVVHVLKAAVAAGSTGNSTWVGPLVGEVSSVYADFIEYLRPQTIVGQFGTGSIPNLRRVPFRVPLIGQSSGGSGYWVGEGAPKPLTKFDFNRTTLEPLKVANIAVLTNEAIQSSSPAADVIVRDQLVAALRERMDIDFVNPAKAAVAGVSPASITNGITPIPSSGTDAEAVRTDIRALFAAFIAANNAPTTGVWIMSATTALALSLMHNPIGQPEFPGISMMGGTFQGMPVIISEYVPAGIVILANAQDIYLGDDGGFNVDMSQEASLQMDDAPTNNSVTPTPTEVVSLWQTNSTGFRAERIINWARRRQTSVAYLTGVNWGVTPPTP